MDKLLIQIEIQTASAMNSFFRTFALLVCSFALANSHSFTVRNQCSQTLWIGTHGDNDVPMGGGFKLDAGASQSFTAINKWTSGRIWGRTGCDSNGQNCDTGDCGQAQCGGTRTTFDAVTLAEFGLDQWNDLDFWDISLVDGFNLPMSIRPVPGTVNADSKCRNVDCAFNFGVCPSELQQYGKDGQLVACKSACTATREDQYCCPEPPYTRDTCPQPSDYSRIFKNQCPDAYSYAYDDETSMFACKSTTPGSSGYEVVFCP